MSELTLTFVRLAFVVLLWVLVLIIVSVMRADLRAPRVAPRGPAARAGAPAPRPARESRKRRGVPKSLVVTEGALAGTTVSLGSAPITLGRAPDSTLVLDDDYASHRHARIAPEGDTGSWLVEDLGSTNGTYVGRSRIAGPTRLPVGTPVRVGKTVLELRK